MNPSRRHKAILVIAVALAALLSFQVIARAQRAGDVSGQKAPKLIEPIRSQGCP